MLTEVISQWFKDASIEHWLTLGGILLALAILRIVAVPVVPDEIRSHPGRLAISEHPPHIRDLTGGCDPHSECPTYSVFFLQPHLLEFFFPEDPTMDCILFRHGIAVDWRDWQKEDHSRPLTDEGIEKTQKAVKGLIRLDVTPTHLLAAPTSGPDKLPILPKKRWALPSTPNNVPNCVRRLS